MAASSRPANARAGQGDSARAHGQLPAKRTTDKIVTHAGRPFACRSIGESCARHDLGDPLTDTNSVSSGVALPSTKMAVPTGWAEPPDVHSPVSPAAQTRAGRQLSSMTRTAGTTLDGPPWQRRRDPGERDAMRHRQRRDFANHGVVLARRHRHERGDID